jgi:hypothetical protein
VKDLVWRTEKNRLKENSCKSGLPKEYKRNLGAK